MTSFGQYVGACVRIASLCQTAYLLVFLVFCQISFLVRTPSCDFKFGESASVALLLGFIIDWVCEMGSQKGNDVSFVKNFCLNNIKKG